MTHVSRLWNKYWFTPAPLFDLAVVRIAAVVLQLWLLLRHDFLGKLLQHVALPDALYEPLPVLQFFLLPFGLHYRPGAAMVSVVFYLTLFVGVLALIGWRTRLNLGLFALGNVFIQAFLYSFGDHHHSEAVMMLALVALACSPAGGVLSLDHLLQRLRSNSVQKQFAPTDLTSAQSAYARWPLLLLLWLFSLIYFSAAFSKVAVGGSDWVNGYTLRWFLLSDGLRENLPLGIWLSQQQELIILSSWATLFFEGFYFLVLFFPRFRWFFLLSGIGLHVGIELAMGATFFQFVALQVAMLPWRDMGGWLNKRLASRNQQRAVAVFYDGQCSLCIRSMTLLNYFDWFGQLRMRDLEQHWNTLAERHPTTSYEDLVREMHVQLPDGSLRKGFFAFRVLLWRLPLFWPLALVLHLPFSASIGPRIYGFVASRRARGLRCEDGTCAVHTGTAVKLPATESREQPTVG